MLPELDAPLTFEPLYMERVWGGRTLEERFGRVLPGTAPIGESWELSDREAEQSVAGGITLNELWRDHRAEVFGRAGLASDAERFPLLIKLLDARQTLSLQVHPPAAVAPELGGEPKSEAWLVVDADEDACLYAGLRAGIGRAEFEAAVRGGGDVAALLHRLPVSLGDALVVPSGRVHAIGGGCVILEVQQSSDTTYRVDDFGRVGLDGKPRELHVEQSLRCIDFGDVEPELVRTPGTIADWEHFSFAVTGLGRYQPPDGEAAIVAVVEGEARCGNRAFGVGSVFLLAASHGPREVVGDGRVAVILLPGADR